MKNLLLILLVLVSCGKPVKEIPEQYMHQDYLPESVASAKGGKPGKPPKPPTQQPPPTINPGGLVFITFAPHYESNPGWRGFTFQSGGSGMPNQAEAVAQAAAYYTRYNVDFTTDEYRYQQYTGKKIMAQVTDDTWDVNYPATGRAFHGSMQVGGGTCYVFAKALQWNYDWVAKLIGHEVGHTTGLYHQEVYNHDCTHVTNYRPDAIMGVCYYSEYCRWVFGQTWSCQTWEDDDKKLTAFFGLR